MKRSKTALEGGRPRRPGRQRTIGLELLERRELLANTLDLTFGAGGRTLASIVTPGAANATYGAVTTQPDGKFIIVGTATNANNNSDFAIARLNADGSPDFTFGTLLNPTTGQRSGVKLVDFELGGGNNDVATGVAVQTDLDPLNPNDPAFRIVVSGTANSSYIALTRLLPNGDFDNSFEGDGKFNTNETRFSLVDSPDFSHGVFVAVQPFTGSGGFFKNDIIVAGGNIVIRFDGDDGARLANTRVTFTGNTGDPGTPPTGGLNADTLINDIAIDPLTGKIVVVGEGTITPTAEDTFQPPGTPNPTVGGVARIHPGGGNDFSFGEFVAYSGYNPSPTLPNITANPKTVDSDLTDNPFYFPVATFSLITPDSAQRLDPTRTMVATGVAIGPNNTIYVVGTVSDGNRTGGAEGRMVLARLIGGEFTFRGDYNPNPGPDGFPSNLRRYGNHSFWSATNFGYFNDSIREGAGIADGFVDFSFSTGIPVFTIENVVKGLDIAYDPVTNTVVAIGYRNVTATQQEFAIVRTDANGRLDTNFTNSFGQDVDLRFQAVGLSQVPGADLAEDVVLLPDGRIVVVGTTSDGTTTDIGLLRLLTEEPPTISISDAVVTEGDFTTPAGVAVFTVSLSHAYRVAITVNVSAASGTAIFGTDFGPPTPTTVTFCPGATSALVAVPVISEPLDEPDETFFVNLFSPVIGTILDGQGQGTILDNDPPHPTISISDAILDEGHSGTANAVFTVTLSRSFELPISVDLGILDGTAVFGSDFGLPDLTTLVFAPGVTSLQVAVPVFGDPFEEGDETFSLGLVNPVLGTILDGQGVGTIVNDDPTPPTISISDAVVTEKHAGTSFASFTVSLSAPYIHGILVDLGILNGTAVFGPDFGLPDQTTLFFAPGQTSVTVNVPVFGDPFQEGDETFSLGLVNPFLGTILDGQGVGTITNDDPPPPSISISDATVTEVGSGTVNAVFTVSLSSAYIHPISVNVSTANGTAFFGPDFSVLTPTTLTFLPGVTSLPVTVPVFADFGAEAPETFTVNLSNPSLGTILDGQGLGTILDLPPDVTGPVVMSATAVRTGGPRRQRITGFELQFNEALNPSAAQNANNFIVNELRRGPGRLGRPRRLGLRSVQYDPTRNVVTIVPAGQAQFRRGALVTVGMGVTDRAGNPLDGNADGSPGPAGLYLL